MQKDLFGKSFVDADRSEQIPLFHEPIADKPAGKLSAADKRIAKQYDPAATPPIWTDKEDARR